MFTSGKKACTEETEILSTGLWFLKTKLSQRDVLFSGAHRNPDRQDQGKKNKSRWLRKLALCWKERTAAWVAKHWAVLHLSLWFLIGFSLCLFGRVKKSILPELTSCGLESDCSRGSTLGVQDHTMHARLYCTSIHGFHTTQTSPVSTCLLTETYSGPARELLNMW